VSEVTFYGGGKHFILLYVDVIPPSKTKACMPQLCQMHPPFLWRFFLSFSQSRSFKPEERSEDLLDPVVASGLRIFSIQ
jgi:hypothetical protein